MKPARATTALGPLVSVVIPTYNRSAFVTKAIDSVLHQTYANREVIVVDDGSTDSTREALGRYGDLIRCLRQDNRGASAARNAGIAVACGQWLAFVDSDDEWKPEYLAKQIERAVRNPGLSMQSTDCRLVELDGSSRTYFEINGTMRAFRGRDYLLVRDPFSFVVSHGPWQVGATIFRRDAVAKAGPYDTRFVLSEDFDFMARVALHGDFGLIRDELVDIYRRDETTRCLTDWVRKDWIGARKANEVVYEKLGATQPLRYAQRRALAAVIGNNRRAIGNLLMLAGDRAAARDSYRRAFVADRSWRSVARYAISYLPGAALAARWPSRSAASSSRPRPG